jgi:hypothetical protein
MRTKITILGFVIALTAILCQIPAQGSNNAETVTTKARLEALVDEYIACCEAKSALRNSRSEKIRHSAVRSCMKADFYRHSKEELVEVMLENNIAPKAYKVRLFLNERFNVILQAKE